MVDESVDVTRDSKLHRKIVGYIDRHPNSSHLDIAAETGYSQSIVTMALTFLDANLRIFKTHYEIQKGSISNAASLLVYEIDRERVKAIKDLLKGL